jgi:hypothetical protein
MTHTASCRCGQLRATVTGDPVRVSVCHCLDCKKRSGSSFAIQARWPANQVTLQGQSSSWSSVGGSGIETRFHFCPGCGTEIYYRHAGGEMAGLLAIPLGTFDDPYFVSPRFSVWEERKHDWLEIVGEGVEHTH